jgi:hypothetical protein
MHTFVDKKNEKKPDKIITNQVVNLSIKTVK